MQYRILPEQNGADLLNGVDDFIKYDLAQETLTAISVLYMIIKNPSSLLRMLMRFLQIPESQDSSVHQQSHLVS
jgi:hypothetical protein